MSNLLLYLPNISFVDNLSSLFFNFLCNNYSNNKFNLDSINYKIYNKILQTFNSDINIKKNISYDEFKIYLNKYIYNLLNQNINSYIDILIKDKVFINELFTYNNFQYYTNQSNEILRLLSDNNTNYDKTFNISKNYNIYKTQFLNHKKNEKNIKLKNKTILVLKKKLYDIFIVIDGLEKIMYSNYNNLLEYENKSFDDMLNIIHNLYGSIHLNYNNIHHIYYKYSNKTINYYDIYHDILTYPSLRDKIVTMFIQFNYLKYNEKINNLILYKQYKHIFNNIFDKFVYEKEQDDDDEIINLSSKQKQTIIQSASKLLHDKYKQILHDNFNNKYTIDNSSYNYKNIYNENISIPIKTIPIQFINSINLKPLKNKDDTKHEHNIITNKEIINEIIPNITVSRQKKTHHNKYNNIINEAENRIRFIKDNKDNVDYMNHTINFFSENFEDDENLTKLKEAISFLNFEFIDHFNINILRINNTKSYHRNNSKLINNIINDINEEDNQQTSSNTTDTFIIDDYNPLSPIYETNFDINIDNNKYTFKTLLHYIYFNQYLELYKIYYNNSNHTELSIISIYTLAYNILFKNSKLNIFEDNKSILSNKTNYKNYTELQTTYHDLLNDIKYYIFKLEVNNKINNTDIPYFNFILSYTTELNIIYSDKEDNYLGIGKYGNGDNMIGIFMNEYKLYLDNNTTFDYDYTDIFYIMCNFNKNIYNWFDLKLKDLLHTIINCCILSNDYNIDIVLINNVLNNLFNIHSSTQIYYLPIHSSFYTFISDELKTLLNNTYSNMNNIVISDKAINELWKVCHIFIHNIFSFQTKIIDNSDDFQTFINYYDKYNIEHLLYYTLSLNNNDDYDQSIEDFIKTKTKQLNSFHKTDGDYTKYAVNILFSDCIDDINYPFLIRKNNESLQFNIENDIKYINIIKSRLSIPQ